MRGETRERLQAILDRYNQKQVEMLAYHEQTKNQREIFLDGFNRKIKEVIRPSFQEVGKMLKSRGHGFEINQKHESNDHLGNTQSAQIKIEILPEGIRAEAGARPSVSFTANSVRKEVWTHVSTIMSGCAGQRNVYTLDEITEDAVENELLSVLASCFG